MDQDGSRSAAEPSAEEGATRFLSRAGWALLALGVLWRGVRYLLCFPVWGDEAMNGINIAHLSWTGFVSPLPCPQIAPLLFWWAERACFLVLGPSELSMRLPALLAGLGALLLFRRLTVLTLQPTARPLALGLLAVAIWPVSMCTFIKPYAFDLLASTILLLAAVAWLRRPEQFRWLVVLTLAVPIALFASFPSLFVAAAVGPALLPTLWRRRRPGELVLFGLYHLLLLAAFAGSHLYVAHAQLDPADPFNDFLRDYWAHGFPPAAPLAFLKWAVLVHTGRLMAYPVGGSDGQSVLTFLLFLVGLWGLWRQRRLSLLVLFLGPFVLGFVAAVLRRYPYGGCCRISQHVAPIVCLLAGSGLADLAGRLRGAVARRRYLIAVVGLLFLVGAIGLVRDLVRPYRGESDLRIRELVRGIDRQAGPADRVVLVGGERETEIVLQWYLCAARGRIVWASAADAFEPGPQARQVWRLRPHCGAAPPALPVPPELRTWRLAEQSSIVLSPASKGDPEMDCELVRWTRPDSPQP